MRMRGTNREKEKTKDEETTKKKNNHRLNLLIFFRHKFELVYSFFLFLILQFFFCFLHSSKDKGEKEEEEDYIEKKKQDSIFITEKVIKIHIIFIWQSQLITIYNELYVEIAQNMNQIYIITFRHLSFHIVATLFNAILFLYFSSFFLFLFHRIGDSPFYNH